jgi:hypothetical protein
MSPHLRSNKTPMKTPYELSINPSKSLIFIGASKVFVFLPSKAIFVKFQLPIAAR